MERAQCAIQTFQRCYPREPHYTPFLKQARWPEGLGRTYGSLILEIVLNHWPQSETMELDDFGGSRNVRSIAQLEQVLRARSTDQLNEFSLTPDSSDYPRLWIFVRGDLAAIYYIPRDDGRAGYVSVGGKMNLNPKEMTTFAIGDAGETIDVLNDSIVPFSEALEAAKEFFHSQEMPRSIKWLEL
jgi:hypothetical protein